MRFGAITQQNWKETYFELFYKSNLPKHSSSSALTFFIICTNQYRHAVFFGCIGFVHKESLSRSSMSETSLCLNTVLKIRSQKFPEMKLHGLVSNFYIYIFPRSVRLFCYTAFADRSWEDINLSQIQECRNRDRGRAVSFLEIFISNFLYSALQCISLS
jgi:hypothetical protein